MDDLNLVNMPNNRIEHDKQNSKKENSQKAEQKQTFEALLSITSAAVDALDKPRTPERTDSVQNKVGESKPHRKFSHPQHVQALSAEVLSEVYAGTTLQQGSRSEDYTNSPDYGNISLGLKGSPNDHEDVSVGSRSSTASDILVRTTSSARDIQSPSDALNLSNISKVSQSSKNSAASSTFLTGHAKKVKVSSKNLKEIRSPFEETKEVTDTRNMGFFQMLDNSSLLKSPERQKENKAPAVDSTTMNSKMSTKVHDLSTRNEYSLNENIKNVDDSRNSYSDSQCGRKVADISVNVVKNHSVSKHTTEHRHSVLVERHNTDINVSQLSEPTVNSREEYNRKKATQEFSSALDSGYQTKQLSTKTLFGTQSMNDLKRPSSSGANTSADVEGIDVASDSSCTQPEIYDVPEAIITIQAQNGNESSGSSCLDVHQRDVSSLTKCKDIAADGLGLPESFGAASWLQDRLSKYHVPLLKQGALSDHKMDSPQTNGDCIVTKLGASNKQKSVKKELANRSRQRGPVKKIVRPQIVQHTPQVMPPPQDTTSSTGGPDPVTTAAVAASAAVAATQPFLHAQHEMDSKMTAVLEKLAILQEESRKETGSKPIECLVAQKEINAPKVQELEKQLNDLTQRRLDYLEKMQEQQMSVQAQLLSISRHRSPTVIDHHSTAKYPKQLSPKQYTRVPTAVAADKVRNGVDTMLDTPAPRRKPPMPTAYQAEPIKPAMLTPSQPSVITTDRPKSGQLFRQILSSGDETPLNGPFPTTPSSNRDEISHHTAVRHAGELVNELSDLKTHMKHVLSDAPRINEYHPEDLVDPSTIREEYVPAKPTGPAPLDAYLTRPDHFPATSPYPKMLPTGNAPVVANYSDAEMILKDVQRTRANLEANLDLILRSKGDLDVYGLIDELAKEGLNSERVRIMKMVDAQIARMGPQMQKEILTDIMKMEEKEQFRKEMMERLIPERDTDTPIQAAGKPGQKNSRPTVAQTRTTGLRNRNAGVESKINMGLKKTVPQRNYSPPKSTRFKKPVSSSYPSEAYINRVYGKNVGQPARSSQRNAQLRQASVATKHSPISHKGVEKTKPIKAPSGKSQYYFDPTSQPLSGLSAPVHGQLVPMAIPLGAPRQQGSLPAPQYIPSTPQIAQSHIFTSTPVAQASPDRAKTGLVTFKDINDDTERKLTKQVLPGVDIDSEPPSTVADDDEASAKFEKQPKNNVSQNNCDNLPSNAPLKNFITVSATHVDTEHTDDEASESTIVEDDTHDSQPIALPGYHHPTPAKYHGPSFPPQAPSLVPITSSELAVNIGARDSIQHTAMEWVEQELMARILSEIATNKNPQIADEQERQRATREKHVHVEPEEVSEASETSTSSHHDSLLAEAVGQEGLQLFVDAGVPMDETLVNRLIREVLMEKAGTMIGKRTGSEDKEHEERNPSPMPRPRSPAKITTPRAQSPIKTTIRSPVPTPEPTPVSSPVPSPRRVVSPPPSPELSEAVEKPQEQLAAYVDDSTEEDVTLPPMPPPVQEIPQEPPSSPLLSRHDVMTPIVTPREDPERPYTPEISVAEIPPVPEPVIPPSPEKPELQDAMTQYHESEDELESIHEVAVQTTPPPSPVLQEKKISPIMSPESSLSETQLENISEGQWLVSGMSEGEVRVPIQLHGVGHGVRPHAAGSEPDDTLYEADDLDQRQEAVTMSPNSYETDVDPVSEGEFLHRGPVDRGLLAAMSQATNQPVQIIEQILQQQNLLPQPKGILKGRSGGLPKTRSAGEIMSGETASAGQIIQVTGANAGTARAFSSHLHRQTSQDLESPGEFEHEKPKYPVASPRKRSSGSVGSLSSADQHQSTPDLKNSLDDIDASLSESRGLSGTQPKEPQMRLTVGGKRTGSLSGPIMATDAPSRSRRGSRGGRGGSRPSMSVSRSFSPPPDTGPTTDISMDASATSGARVIQVGQSADSALRDTLDDLRGTGASMEFGGGTRTMTPDQMNVEALLQSRDYFNTGTQSDFESTGGALRENPQRSTEFGGTCTLRRQGTFNVADTRDSFGGSYGEGQMTGTQDSAGLQQSSEFLGDQTSESAAGYRGRNQFQSEDYNDTLGGTSDSVDLRGSMQYPDSLEGTGNYNQYAQTLEAMISQTENDLDRRQKTGPLALSVTIPSMEQSESAAEESDVSEFSIGNYTPSYR